MALTPRKRCRRDQELQDLLQKCLEENDAELVRCHECAAKREAALKQEHEDALERQQESLIFALGQKHAARLKEQETLWQEQMHSIKMDNSELASRVQSLQAQVDAYPADVEGLKQQLQAGYEKALARAERRHQEGMNACRQDLAHQYEQDWAELEEQHSVHVELRVREVAAQLRAEHEQELHKAQEERRRLVEHFRLRVIPNVRYRTRQQVLQELKQQVMDDLIGQVGRLVGQEEVAPLEVRLVHAKLLEIQQQLASLVAQAGTAQVEQPGEQHSRQQQQQPAVSAVLEEGAAQQVHEQQEEVAAADLRAAREEVAEVNRRLLAKDEQHKKEVCALAKKHEAQLVSQAEQQQRQHAAEAAEMRAEHEVQLAAMRAEHDAQVSAMRAEHEQAMAAAVQQLTERQQLHGQEVAGLHQEMDSKVQQLKGQLHQVGTRHKNAVSDLKAMRAERDQLADQVQQQAEELQQTNHHLRELEARWQQYVAELQEEVPAAASDEDAAQEAHTPDAGDSTAPGDNSLHSLPPISPVAGNMHCPLGTPGCTCIAGQPSVATPKGQDVRHGGL